MATSNLHVGYYIPMSVIVALILDNCLFGTARFLCVKHKASQITPFLYIGSRPAASALGLRHCSENRCKGTHFSNSDSVLHKNNTFARPVTLFCQYFR